MAMNWKDTKPMMLKGSVICVGALYLPSSKYGCSADNICEALHRMWTRNAGVVLTACLRWKVLGEEHSKLK